MIEFEIKCRENVFPDDYRISILVNGQEVGHAAGDKKILNEDSGTCYFRLDSLVVISEYRSNDLRFGDKLIKQFEAIALENKAIRIEGEFGHGDHYIKKSEKERIVKQTEFYNRNGYLVEGETFRKNLPNL